jgi:hypothetical protein
MPRFLNLFRVFADENGVENAKHPWRPLGQMLVERGLIDTEQLEIALREQAQTGEPIGSVLVALEYIPEQTLRNVLLEQCGLDMTRQEGFGSGLLSELERRRGVVHRAVSREQTPAPEQSPTPASPSAPDPDPVVPEPVPMAAEPVAVAVAAPTAETAPPEEPATSNGASAAGSQHENGSFSIDSLLETFEERSRALSAELAAMRRLLHEIAG